MKKVAGLLVMIGMLWGLCGCSVQTKEDNRIMSDACRVILDYLNCDYERIKNDRNTDAMISRFNDLRSQGKEEGFTPLMILPSDTLAEYLEESLEENGYENTVEGTEAYRQSIIEAAASMDAEVFLSTALDRYLSGYNSDDAILGEFVQGEPRNEITLHMLAYGRYEEVIIAKVPTQNPWELAAWMPMGGWNACPSPVEQVAVFRYWYEKYGAVPAVVGHDIWEMTLMTPPVTQEEALVLAKEHFAFGSEDETIRGLASALKDANMWFFWWD